MGSLLYCCLPLENDYKSNSFENNVKFYFKLSIEIFLKKEINSNTNL